MPPCHYTKVDPQPLPGHDLNSSITTMTACIDSRTTHDMQQHCITDELHEHEHHKEEQHSQLGPVTSITSVTRCLPEHPTMTTAPSRGPRCAATLHHTDALHELEQLQEHQHAQLGPVQPATIAGAPTGAGRLSGRRSGFPSG